MQTAPVPAIGYIRVSTEEQARSGHSIEQQRERLLAWGNARLLRYVDILVDAGVSASKPLHKRPAGAELLRRIRAGEAQVAVVVSIDRMFRDAQDGLNTLLGQGRQPGLPLQSVTDPCDTTTAMGRFILTVWLARAQLEREQTCERNTAVARGLRQAGRPNGYTPYGCVLVDGRLYRDPVTWAIREQIVALSRGTGPLAGPRGTRAIATLLEAESIAAPRGGGRWSKTTVGRVIASHDGLNHIPALPTAEETPLSPEHTA